jgi:hypothetical protein
MFDEIGLVFLIDMSISRCKCFNQPFASRSVLEKSCLNIFDVFRQNTRRKFVL